MTEYWNILLNIALLFLLLGAIAMYRIRQIRHPDYKPAMFYIERTKFSDGFLIENREDSYLTIESCNSHYKHFKSQRDISELVVTYKKPNSLKREKLASWYKSEPSHAGVEFIRNSTFNPHVDDAYEF